MDNNTTQIPENTPSNIEVGADQTPLVETGQETLEVSVQDTNQEQIPTTQANQGQNSTAQAQVDQPAEPVVINKPVNVNMQTAPALKDEDDDIEAKDLPWVKRAEKIIKQDKDKPYEEEEDSENLQQEYLAKNYGVKVEKDNIPPPVK